ncbi:NACHT domain-containing protein [Streptomyces sp. S4.7]|uniref:NACHT domain-containing protein n=1 Tax=Streptomyces sp. S4.7 TaxID=2705439 RepID=UPI0013DB8E56|nr:NACHT domain-containing protein [Streptomyces sp. S4.7]
MFGVAQGSGYLLSTRLVLTARHLLGEDAETTVVVPGGRGRIRCRTLWAGDAEEGDAALLRADEGLVTHGPGEAFPPNRFGRIDGLTPLLDCYALGYPRVQRYEGQKPDMEQFLGTIKPGSGSMRGEYVVEGTGTPPAVREDGESPWAGMSGAPVFSGRHLIGVVTKDSAGWQHSRLNAVSLLKLSNVSAFANAYRVSLAAPLRFTALRQTPDNSAEFEDRYRTYIAETFGELSIFGLDFSRSEHAQWPLDSAYLSLELVHDHGEAGESGAPERGRVETALRDRRRVLLRGAAGSGKTTLVQWLAVNAARDSFGGQLAHLGGRVPVVLPLRTLVRGAALPTPAEFLSAAGHPLSPPAGWMDAVLVEGRGLLLVDGVDEMPEADRTRTKEWLLKLLAAYPLTAVVVTTRPTAVDDGWLSRKDFAEFLAADEPAGRHRLRTALAQRGAFDHPACRRAGRTRSLRSTVDVRAAPKTGPRAARHQPPHVRDDLCPAPRPAGLPSGQQDEAVRRGADDAAGPARPRTGDRGAGGSDALRRSTAENPSGDRLLDDPQRDRGGGAAGRGRADLPTSAGHASGGESRGRPTGLPVPAAPERGPARAHRTYGGLHSSDVSRLSGGAGRCRGAGHRPPRRPALVRNSGSMSARSRWSSPSSCGTTPVSRAA